MVWCLINFLSLSHLSHLVWMEFIHIPLRNAQSVYAGHYVRMLYNQSLQSGQLPLNWKCANIIPVFKKGVKSKASNYQPISLTSQIIKILESIICDSIHKLIADHNIIHPHQHGFVPRKSCLTKSNHVR